MSIIFFTGAPIFSIFCGLWTFVSARKHLLGALISLEYVMLSVYWFMGSLLSSMGEEVFFSLFFLTFAACEGALGLSLLVCVVRSHGNDNFSSFSFLKC
uniref:NADH-ubiquinone oxidoreductase chain 4L n=1 Tax=Lysmata amboinensis TaxID=575568 RepID=A0A7G7WQF9_9EUCA|nr:NADH dehydrogenase subunit 4L [Lysmata amboinensis]QNH68786.1 NADH dehydrogenase subunit 4L [Lysmata amboinensis]